MKACAEDRLLRELLKLIPISSKQPLGPGDDCAALHPLGKNQLLLLKTDPVLPHCDCRQKQLLDIH